MRASSVMGPDWRSSASTSDCSGSSCCRTPFADPSISWSNSKGQHVHGWASAWACSCTIWLLAVRVSPPLRLHTSLCLCFLSHFATYFYLLLCHKLPRLAWAMCQWYGASLAPLALASSSDHCLVAFLMPFSYPPKISWPFPTSTSGTARHVLTTLL